MGSTLRKRGKEDQNQRMGAQKNQRAGPSQSPGSSSLLSKTLLPIVVISLFYLHFLQPDLSPFNWIQNLTTSITEFSVRDSLNLALRPPTKSFAICSFGSYPPSKSSSTAIARIYTVDQAQEETHGENGATHCMVVKDEKIHILTDGEGVENWCDGKNCDVRVLDEGQAILPGLFDSHGHLIDYSLSLSSANLLGCTSPSEVVERLEAYVLASPAHLSDPQKWIQGLGWDQTKFSPPIFPDFQIFESSKLLKGRRISLKRIDVHALWVSKSVIEELESSGDIPDSIPGGLVLKDSNGKPTGIFIDNAMNFVLEISPKISAQDREKFVDEGIEKLLSFGITNVGDAALDPETYQFLRKKAEMKDLKIRIWGMLDCSNHKDGPFCGIGSSSKATNVELTPKTRMEVNHKTRFTLRAVKLFVDGALGSWGSAMWDDYEDRKGERGLLLLEEDEVERRVRGWHERGFQVASHAIGDRANSILLSVYSRLLQDLSARSDLGPSHELDLRLRIEHAQILRKEDVIKLHELGVIASMQPTRCTSDMSYVETRIGKRRAKEGAYVWGDLLASNATLVFGSDFPVESPSIFEGFFSSISRLDASLNSPHGPEGWFPSQRLTRTQTLKAFTSSASFGQFEENFGGSLSPGKRADFVVLDRDVMDERRTGLLEVRETKVLSTWIDGQVVWRRV